jgi:ribose/xylose/arabinose/galactoside ABC-type transport system permease subunit
MCFALFIAIALALSFLLKYTPFGVKLMLLGSNAKAARYGGINEKRMLLITYTLCGLLASGRGIDHCCAQLFSEVGLWRVLRSERDLMPFWAV